jgi:hypothetical protein
VLAMKDGERGRNRTYNLLIKSQLLCQLSYAPAIKEGLLIAPGNFAAFAAASAGSISCFLSIAVKQGRCLPATYSHVVFLASSPTAGGKFSSAKIVKYQSN